jgi:hypothetical protein
MIVDEVWKLTNTVRVGLDPRSSLVPSFPTVPFVQLNEEHLQATGKLLTGVQFPMWDPHTTFLYIALMIWINHSMNLPLTRSESIGLTTIITHLLLTLVVAFMHAIPSTSGRLHSEFVRLLFLQTHRETDRFFAASGVQLPQSNSGLFHFQSAAFSSHLKTKVGSTLSKVAPLRVILNLDGSPITSRTHTQQSHSQTSRLLTSSLSLGVPVPRTTQCMRVVSTP